MYLLDKLSSILNSDDRSSTLYSFAYYVYTHLFEVSDMTINELSGKGPRGPFLMHGNIYENSLDRAGFLLYILY